MAELIFKTTNTGISESKNSMIGKWENPLRMIIQDQSDICAKTDNLARTLYMMDTSKHFGESFAGQNEFDIFAPVEEGGDAPRDTFGDVYDKFIKHTTFKKQFRVTEEMMEDSLTSPMKRKARGFVRAYWRTRNLFAHSMLIGATAATVTFGPTGKTKSFDTTTADGLPLFSTEHEGGGNRLHYVLGDKGPEFAAVKSVLTAIASQIRNMKDERGYAMGYTANQIIISSNDPLLEEVVKAVLGSEFGSGTGGMLTGEMNLHYGNWELVVDPLWQRTVSTSHPMIVTSTAARDNLAGAVFLTRKPLTVSAHVDQNSDDYIWNGSARHSAGFVTHKWAFMAELLDKGTTALLDGGVAGTNSLLLSL